MKDLPHHIKKLNRRIIRSMHQGVREELLPDLPPWPDSERQKKKKAKIKMRDETRGRSSTDLTPDQRNKAMKGGRKGRVPVFDQNKGTAKRSKASRKKTPRI